jgi:dienelactone hydrolase
MSWRPDTSRIIVDASVTASFERAWRHLRCGGRALSAGALCLLMVAPTSMTGAVAAVAADAPVAITGMQRDVVFSDYSPLSSSMELGQRLLSPLNSERIRRQLLRSGQALREQPVDLAHEQFAVYAPAEAPARGYALLVFVPPWQEAMVPPGWPAVLDRHGMIYVSAAKSGNEENVLDRREPLALLAAQNIMHRYRVDPERVYIGGFSGGSRVALRIALGYPDVFHGALLIAGSDPIADAQGPLPAADLFQQLQNSTRFVYLTGTDDAINLEKDAGSRQSLRAWCVFDLDTEVMPWTGHDVAEPSSLNRALAALTSPAPVEPAKLAACRAHLATELNLKLHQLADVVASGKLNDARALLQKIDARYGGLAAPRSLELAEQIDPGR